MGSGDAARDVSSRTLSLMESFYKTGMPSDTVLATVNSLISYSADERFSCLDLAAVNLDDGNADIVKIGSPGRLPPYGGRAEDLGRTIPADGRT